MEEALSLNSTVPQGVNTVALKINLCLNQFENKLYRNCALYRLARSSEPNEMLFFSFLSTSSDPPA